MECEECTENGRDCVKSWREASWARLYQHELGNTNASKVRLDFTTTVPRETLSRQMYLGVVPADRSLPQKAPDHVSTELPFMSNMDEITYWIYTKRAPCLMNYDNVLKKQSEVAHCSKEKPKSIHSDVQEVPSPKKKKKRKLLMSDDISVSTEKQQNLYFDVSHKQNKKTIISSCKSDTTGSDIDFNIKNSSVQGRRKRSKLQKNSRTTVHKKNKIITSTPKVTSLRRSLRQAQQSLNNSHLNNSFVFNSSVVNGNNFKNTTEQQPFGKLKKSEILTGGDQNGDKQNITKNEKSNILNGQFEDLSDVSGFTANYIRSTKVQSSKTPRKLRCKSTRNLVKESRQSLPKESKMIVCVNKGTNIDSPKAVALNCSTDSSQNIINLVTSKSNDKSTRINKSTSLLKFMDSKQKSDNKQNSEIDLNNSSQQNISRYPKRHKATNVLNNGSQNTMNLRRTAKKSSDFDNSERKENPVEKNVSKTRSGRSIGLTIRPPENSVLVLSNSTEQVSSMTSMNVASPKVSRSKLKKKCTPNKTARTRRTGASLNNRDSLRDKSGFGACFSDSDDSEPLQRKFFCT